MDDLIQAKDLNLGEEELIKYYCSTANNFTKKEICSILNTSWNVHDSPKHLAPISLKKWGFCIHGCVDGFSRKLLWLKVATTNNDPLVIANYYLQHIKSHKIVPSLIRMDKGSENIYCDDLQAFFTGDQNCPIRYFHP